MTKSEAKVKSLTFQKKLIVTQYEAYKECVAETLRWAETMAGIDPTPPTKITAKCRFRAAVRAVTTMHRIKWLIARSKTICILIIYLEKFSTLSR
ncbi:hypothetical protein EB796_009669 [Bugula neritina]|uniref:Pericentrin/AKAP-450 centrosomal targeting domain-containing protein n=1 Tax=Bugula neritina TaxID=10212 RepID=A0A7J7K359_BUGNE|nr:hypothetical protein EB796_009669 [Bugula neritina]